jgi:beta-glucosidase
MESFASRGVPRREVVDLAAAGSAVAPGTSTIAEPSAQTELRFPERFGWGAATSAYQIEGATTADGRGESIWDRFSHTPGLVRNGDTGDVAADHYHRYEADLDLMRSLGLHSYRFSVSWSRIQPEGRGPVNAKGLDFYCRLVDGLRMRGIAPVVTLFHWDLPQRLQDAGGWENRDCAYWFADYAKEMFRALRDAGATWLTINEPKTVVCNGYISGHHAPGKQDQDAAYVVAHHLQLAHGLAVEAFRSINPRGGRIGPALNLAPAYPFDDTDESRAAAQLADAVENRLYLDPILRGEYPADLLATFAPSAPIFSAIRDGDLATIASTVDILAVQYYNPVFVTGNGEYRKKYRTSEAFWQEIYPDGFYDILVRLKRDYGDIPITITENGIPTPDRLESANGNGASTVDDAGRIAFLRDHLNALHRAIADGVAVESYHVWSLMDNFEWAEGYGQRWGIVYVDYPSQRRIWKSSAHWYRDVIANNGF